jgi:hypothetical protein
MSDTDYNADKITVRVLCDRLRANDPRLLVNDSFFELFNDETDRSEDECIAVFQALKENTSVKHFDFRLSERHYTKRSVLAAADYVESSKTLQSITLHYDSILKKHP